MTGSPLRQDGRSERPLVAVIWSLPLLTEGLGEAIDFAELAAFPAAGTDVGSLLRWLRPDALIVDAEEAAAAAMPYARENELPILHIVLEENELRLYRAGAWEWVSSEDGAAPEAVRSIVAGAIYARAGAQ